MSRCCRKSNTRSGRTELVSRVVILPLPLSPVLTYLASLSYLPSHPYNESVALNVLAGQLSLYLSQPPSQRHSSDSDSDSDASSAPPSSASSRPKKRSLQKMLPEAVEEPAPGSGNFFFSIFFRMMADFVLPCFSRSRAFKAARKVLCSLSCPVHFGCRAL